MRMDGALIERHRIGGYTAWTASPAGPSLFDMVWIARADAVSPAPHRVLPLGEPSLAVRRRRDRTEEISSVELVICATFDRAYWYRPEPDEELIAVRLRPEVAGRMLGISACEHVNADPVEAPRGLRDRLSSALRAGDHQDAVGVALALVADLRRITPASDCDEGLVARAAILLRAREGRISARGLAAEIDVSERHLRRCFSSVIGCSPKTYARRLRLAKAAIDADHAAVPNWADIALAAGFHDQAHLIGECRAFTGLTPAQLDKERRAGSVFSNTPAPR